MAAYTPRYLALIGLLVWLVLSLIFWPESPLSLDYVRLILIAAPLMIVPLCLGEDGMNPWRVLAVAIPFGMGILLPAGLVSFVLVLPWWFLSGYLIYRDLKANSISWKLERLLGLVQPLFLFIAACWALADRSSLHPLGFSPDIVLLTAVHFHYAGFTLVWLVAKISEGPDWMRWGIVCGVALVALGITTSQYGLPYWIEIVSVNLLAVAALRFSFLLAVTASGRRKIPSVLGAAALSAGMVLALLYGWRHVFPIPALNIPMMYALHGSLNSLGFALPAVWAYTLIPLSPALPD